MSLPKSVTSNEQAKLIYPKYTLYGHSFSSVAFATLEILEPFESFPGGSVAKNPPANAGDIGSSLEMKRFPGKQNGDPLQYSCLRNLMNRGAWWATVNGVMRVELDLVTKQQQQQDSET